MKPCPPYRSRLMAAPVAAILCGAALLDGGDARAQAAPAAGAAIPGAVDPGQIQRRLAPEQRRASPSSPILPEVTQASAPEQTGEIRFELRGVVVEGASAYREADFAPLYEKLLNRTVSLADVYRLADAITMRYRSDGYVLSRAIVPAQQVATGEVRIRVVEGFIHDVRYEGPATAPIRAYGEIATRSRPLRAADLERALLLMNDLPGVVARGTLAPAQGVTGGSDLVVTITQAPVQASLTFDNRGTTFVGPLQLFAQAGINNLTGGSDSLELRFVTTPERSSELRYYELDYARPLSGGGAILSISANWSDTKPGGALRTDFLETVGEAETVTARISYPVIRRRRGSLLLDGGLVMRNARLDQRELPSRTALITSYDDRLREAHLGLTLEAMDGWRGRNLLRVELAQGLPVLGASAKGRLTGGSRPGGVSTFTKGSADFSRLQDLGALTPGLGFLTAVSGGGSFGQTLLASAQYALGGAQFGRGYDPAELTGDYLLAAKAELHYDAAQAAFLPGLAREAGIRYLQLYHFFDFGTVWDQSFPGLPGAAIRGRSLMSAGAGVRAGITDRFMINIEAGKPLTRGVAALAGRGNARPFRFAFVVGTSF